MAIQKKEPDDDNLNSFVAEGLLNGGISNDFETFKNQNFLVVTTAKGLHHYTDNEKFKNYASVRFTLF